MIHESSPWKAALARDADLIERWAAKPRESERRSFLFEQKLFLAAYSLRKLNEAMKLSTETLGGSIAITRYAPTQTGYSEVNNHRFDRFFDLERPQATTLPVQRLVNVLIHSLIFIEALADDWTIQGFMVTSDNERERGLIQVDLPVFIGLMRRAADDFPSSMRGRLDGKTGKWDIWSGHGDPPDRP